MHIPDEIVRGVFLHHYKSSGSDGSSKEAARDAILAVQIVTREWNEAVAKLSTPQWPLGKPPDSLR